MISRPSKFKVSLGSAEVSTKPLIPTTLLLGVSSKTSWYFRVDNKKHLQKKNNCTSDVGQFSDIHLVQTPQYFGSEELGEVEGELQPLPGLPEQPLWREDGPLAYLRRGDENLVCGTLPTILSRDPFFERKPSEPQGKQIWFLKRTRVEIVCGRVPGAPGFVRVVGVSMSLCRKWGHVP